MDPTEKCYRLHLRDPIAIRKLVQSLLDSGRLLEAAFYFEKLKKLKPQSYEVNKLGYLLSIKRLDPHVQAYDIALKGFGGDSEDLHALRLAYYIAFSNLPLALEEAKYLCTLDVSERFTMDVLIQTIEETHDEPLSLLFFDKQLAKIIPSPKLEKTFRQILIKRLIRVARNIHD
ncbi:hypothetical protein [Burkholderia oklahomensis]|uniref:hypothetical protein n=1 Tax=Burkholderia oklahomensis TaxID=342113 RepID=UPI000AF5C65B|nr:hypothetical protein [Burkholderia oklahomensis]MBI0360519.1 hypothetical protein [Burkholderia oklahomensis]QPS37999.1 hypothetical protein I6G57_03965 [Burkholderia oklahomensis]